MSKTPARASRRRSVARVVAVAGLLGATPGIGLAYAGSNSHHGSGGCPAAESLVPGTKFTHHTLAKGVTMSEGTTKDSAGSVNIHVLRVDLTQPRVKVVPLMHSLANRQPLSALAANQTHLVAATNTGYFDFMYGAPLDPVITKSQPDLISSTHQRVIGIDKKGRLETGEVWSAATVTANKVTRPLVATNEVTPPNGISVYNSKWGPARTPGGWSSDSRSVVGGAVSTGGGGRQGATVPSGGYLLHAKGSSASSWLNGVSNGSKVSISSQLKTNARSPFVQAYGVGVQLVAKPGVAIGGFSCASANTKTPARTAIGWTNGGRTMVMAFVADHPHTSLHGLDEDQMSKLMAQLGVSKAYAFDGSGSTELMAKFRHSSSLKLQTYPADGAERPMPLGLGIAIKPARSHKHH